MKYYMLLLSLVICSCKSTRRSTVYKYLQGDWCLVDKNAISDVNYSRINFESNGIVTLFSKADTIYSYKYRVFENNLLIIRYLNGDSMRSNIFKISDDSLIISSLIEKKDIQIYHRCGKKQRFARCANPRRVRLLPVRIDHG